MRAEELTQFWNAQPFVPFRLVLTDGRVFDVPHRDFIWIRRHLLTIAVPPDPARGTDEGWVFASPMHVVRVEMLSAEAA